MRPQITQITQMDEGAGRQQSCHEPAFTDWKTPFSNWLREQGRAEATVRAYCQDVAAFGRWFEGVNGEAFAPELVTSTDLRGFRQWAVEGRHMTPKSWNRRRIGLSVFCGWAVLGGELSYNPFRGVEPWDECDLPARWLSKVEFSRFMRQVELGVQGASTEAWKAQALRDAALVAVMVYGGLREGEAAALNLGDVTVNERSGKVRVWHGKGGKYREVPLGAEARRALSQWLGQAQGLPVRGEDDALFTGKGGERLSVRSIQRRVKEIGRRAGLDVSPHDLRHTFARRLLDKGVQLTVVSKLLGHARLETTARYVQPGWEDFEKAVE